MGFDSHIRIKKNEIVRIEQFLLKNGFEKVKYVDNGYILFNFYKFIDDQCKYFEGVNFSIVKNKRAYHLCGRNSIFCSPYDLNLHNETLQLIKERFKKNFYTDEGRNKTFETGPLTSGIENALLFPFENLHNKLEDVLFFLSKIEPLSETQISLNKIYGNTTYFNQESFAANVLSIYLVSIIEIYFKNTFINILKCLDKNKVNLIESNTKIPGYAQRQFKNGEIDRFQKIAAGYSFQKLDNIMNTYKYCFNVDLLVIFNKKDRYKELSTLFSTRHGNVHRLEYQYLTENDFIKIYTTLVQTLNDVYAFLCKSYGVKRTGDRLFRTSFAKNKRMVKMNRLNNVNV